MGLLNLEEQTSLAYFDMGGAILDISIAQERQVSFNEEMRCSSTNFDDAFNSLDPSYIKTFLHSNLIAPSLNMLAIDEAKVPFEGLVNYRQSKDSCYLDGAET